MPVLVLAGGAELRDSVTDALSSTSEPVVCAPDWAKALDVALSDRLILVVFDSEQVTPNDWRTGFASLRSRHSGVLGIAIVKAPVTEYLPPPPGVIWLLPRSELHKLPVLARKALAAGPDAELVRRMDLLHLAVLARDRTAISEVCDLLLGLKFDLRRKFPRLDPDEIEMAVDDSIQNYVQDPDQYDPARGSLRVWVWRSAVNKVLDVLRKRKRLRREIPIGIDFSAMSLLSRPEEEILEEELRFAGWQRDLLGMGKSPEERAFLEAKLAGASKRELARLLGLGHLPQSEQEAAVDRVWDRIYRRLVRSGVGSLKGKPQRRRGRKR